METELKKILLAELKKTTPNLGSDLLFERCVNKYLAGMLPALSYAISVNNKDGRYKADEFALGQEKLRKELKRVGKKNEQKYVADIMKRSTSTSLIIELNKGYKHPNGDSMLSKVTLNPVYKKMVMKALLNLKIKSKNEQITANKNEFIIKVNVNPKTLESYIKRTIETINTTKKGEAYKDKLFKYLMGAKQLQVLIHEPDDTNDTAYILEKWEQADSGRIYGHGLSLQRLNKYVRHAALGYCYKYDFKACAFAIMAGLAKALDNDIKVSSVIEYVRNREKIRKAIAKELDIDVDVIKTIFTALGFGAELKDNQKTAIRGELAKAARKKQDKNIRLDNEIYNNLGANEYTKLVFNKTFGYIYEELQVINNTILDYCKNNVLNINGRVSVVS